MKYDIHLFEQLNEEYKSEPLLTSFPEYGADYQLQSARQRLRHLDELVPLRGKKVLEVGCGMGYVSRVLATEYGCSVVGVDIKERREWGLLCGMPNLELSVVDLSNESPFGPESFDLVVSFVAWEHIIHPFAMLEECCRVLKRSGAMYIKANLYRAPNASHRYREVFFPFPHLLFDDEVFTQWYMKHRGRSMTASRLNKLTYSHYKEYFRILGLRVDYEKLSRIPLDMDFYNRFKDKLELYPIFDLELAFFTVLLRRDRMGARQVDPYESHPGGVQDSISYRLGNMLVLAVARPGRNTVLLPYRVVRLGVEGVRWWWGLRQ